MNEIFLWLFIITAIFPRPCPHCTGERLFLLFFEYTGHKNGLVLYAACGYAEMCISDGFGTGLDRLRKPEKVTLTCYIVSLFFHDKTIMR